MLSSIKVQPDWELTNKEKKTVKKDEEKSTTLTRRTKPPIPTTFWVSSYNKSYKEGVHGTYTFIGEKVTSAPSKSDLYKEDPTDFEVTALDKLRLHVSCSKTKAEATIVAPNSTWTNLHSKLAYAISLDIDPSGDFAASGGNNGSVRVWNTTNGMLSRDLKTKGHIAEVNVVKWFPSGKVLCSAGSDLQIKIWSVENSKCVRSYSGHSQGIEGIRMIGRGRNFISCSGDGTARLWDCGKGALSTFATHHEAINYCHIIQDENDTSSEQIVLLCCEDGYLLNYDLRQKEHVSKIKMGSAVNCCLNTESGIIITGLHNGQICLTDPRNTMGPLVSYSKNDAPILDLHLNPTSICRNSSIPLWVANAEGDCSLFEIPTDALEPTCGSQSRVSYELSGVDTEHVTAVTGSNRSLFTASRDGIRAYDLNLISSESRLQKKSNQESPNYSGDGKEEEKRK